MSFEIKKCFSNSGIEIKGMYEIYPKIFGDNRGYFLETYKESDFSLAGLNMKFVQENQSKSTKGVLRGLHFQTNHPQGKLVHTITGQVYDIAVDLRNGSDTFGQFYDIILDSEKQNMIYVPEGFAHGFYVLSDTAICDYKCTDFYDPAGEDGLMWNDPLLGIRWNEIIKDEKPVLSEKDKNHPVFDKNKKYFDINGKWQY